MDPTTRFSALVDAGCEPLDESALAVAAHDHAVDVEAQLGRLDDLAAGFGGTTAVELSRYLFVDCGFAGNRGDYYDARNSFLDAVLDRRLGIPLTLSILAIEVGRRVGVPLVGIGMPGHFLVRDASDETSFWDPYMEGRPLDRTGCEARFRQLHGSHARLRPQDLAPAGPIDIITRMLANLTHISANDADPARMGWVIALRSLLPGADPELRREAQRRRAHLN